MHLSDQTPSREGRNPRRAPPSSAGPRQYSQAAFRTNGRPVTTGLRNPHIGVNDVSGDKDLDRVLEVYPFETPTENRKVGGSTPPLATTISAGQKASDLRFCPSPGCDSGLSVAAIDRQIPRFAVRCCTRCCTELRSEIFGDVRPKVCRHSAGPASHSSGATLDHGRQHVRPRRLPAAAPPRARPRWRRGDRPRPGSAPERPIFWSRRQSGPHTPCPGIGADRAPTCDFLPDRRPGSDT